MLGTGLSGGVGHFGFQAPSVGSEPTRNYARTMAQVVSSSPCKIGRLRSKGTRFPKPCVAGSNPAVGTAVGTAGPGTQGYPPWPEVGHTGVSEPPYFLLRLLQITFDLVDRRINDRGVCNPYGWWHVAGRKSHLSECLHAVPNAQQ